MHISKFFPNFREKFDKIFKHFWKNGEFSIKIIKNCKFFHLFFQKCENFYALRGGAPPPGPSTRRPPYKPSLVDLAPPPKKFLRALMIRITLKRSNFILLSEFTKNIMNIILDGQKSGFHLR